MRIGHFALLVGAFIGLCGCSTMHLDTAPALTAEQAYTSFYPYYAELCAVSEFKKKPGFGVPLYTGGAGGHAVMYLNGVCRDESAHYPTISLCGADTPIAERGVGLSVNAHFKNANWVATQGRDFFFRGSLAPGEALTHAAYERTQTRAKAMHIYDGVEFHREIFDDMPSGMSRPDYMYEVSVVSDYAIEFGRDRYCARVPMDRAAMTRAVEYLNSLNAIYKDGKKEFNWNVLRDNCSHPPHNALAMAGIWEPWATEQFFLFAAFDFPVPKNEFVNLMRRTNDMPIQDLDAIFDDDVARQALLQMDSLPTRPGSLAEAVPAVQDNAVYDTDLRLIFYDQPVLGSYQRHFDQIFSEPRYLDLRANLRHFAALYRQIAREREPMASFLNRHDATQPAQREALTRFYEQYYRYIDREIARVGDALASLRPASPSVAASDP